jgi:hypothetical protein
VERRKQIRNDQFERSVNDDSTTESQAGSQTEGSSISCSEYKSGMQDVTEESVAQAEERRRKRREAKKKREDKDSPSPEPIIPAAVIMPITGMTIFTKDGRAITNDPKDPSVLASQRSELDVQSSKRPKQKRPSLSSGSRSSTQAPKVRNGGSVLAPQGSFTTARHPNMTIQADAIRAKALLTDDRFDTINFDQLQAAADAGDQIAEAHLRQRSRRERLGQVKENVIIPADLPQNAPPVRRRNTIGTVGSRRRSSAEPSVTDAPRKPSAPLMQTIPEDAPSHPR